MSMTSAWCWSCVAGEPTSYRARRLRSAYRPMRFIAFRMPRSDELRRRRHTRCPEVRYGSDRRHRPRLTVVVPLLVFVVAPLAGIFKTSFVTADGIGFGNYIRYINSPKFSKVVGNSLAVAATTTAITVLLAYIFAYAMRRTAMPLKRIFGSVALLPLFAPSLVQALGIVFLFGRNGVINRTFNLGVDIYGFWGIVISDTFYSFPH